MNSKLNFLCTIPVYRKFNNNRNEVIFTIITIINNKNRNLVVIDISIKLINAIQIEFIFEKNMFLISCAQIIII